MNHTGTVCQCYIGIACNEECFLVLLRSAVVSTLVYWLILFVFEIFSFVCLKDLVSLCSVFFIGKSAKYGIEKCNSHVISIAVGSFYFRIVFFRVHTECDVRRKCPWCCCPCEEICILSYYFETNDRRTFFYIFIALCYFLCRKRSSAARTVWHDLESFIQELLVPDSLECPPLRLDEIVIVCYIWVIHVSPETYGIREILPHTFVFPYALFTFLDEWFHTVFFDLVFSVQSEKLLNFELYRKSVCIPSGLSWNFVSFHCTVSWNHILDNTCQNVSDVRFSVGCRRAIVEHIDLVAFTVTHTFSEDVIVFPEFLCLFFSVYKIKIRRNFLIHIYLHKIKT